MYQEVVLSSTFIEFIDKEYKEFDYDSVCYEVLKRLKTEILIISEKTWANEVEKYINNSSRKDFLKTFIANFIQSFRIYKRKISNQTIQKRQISDNFLLEECNLTISINDKILLRELKPIIAKILKEQYDIEIQDFYTYINPPPDSRILTEYKEIELKRNDEFDFFEFLLTYFRNTKKIIIKDAYLLNKQAFKNFKQILEMIKSINNEMNLTVITISDEDRNMFYSQNDGLNVERKIKKAFDNYKLINAKLQIVNRSQQKPRKIETDNYKIHLADSLDFYDAINKKAKKDILITILSKRQKRIIKNRKL